MGMRRDEGLPVVAVTDGTSAGPTEEWRPAVPGDLRPCMRVRHARTLQEGQIWRTRFDLEPYLWVVNLHGGGGDHFSLDEMDVLINEPHIPRVPAQEDAASKPQPHHRPKET